MKAQSPKPNHSSSATHTVLQKSSTLSRRYVRAPRAVTRKTSASAQSISARIVTSSAPAPRRATSASTQKSTTSKTSVVKAATKTKSLAHAASALHLANTKQSSRSAINLPASKPSTSKASVSKSSTDSRIPEPRPFDYDRKAVKNRAKKDTMESLATENAELFDQPAEKIKKHHGRRFALALTCAAITVAALGAFLHFNMPNISVRVAAIQTGVEAKYPSYIPRNYSLASVTAEKDGRIVMTFNGEGTSSFTLTEEKTTWDTSALLNNYVKSYFSSGYSTLREQGITFYTDNWNSAWVNGGILYKITCINSALTKEQITNLVGAL